MWVEDRKGREEAEVGGGVDKGGYEEAVVVANIY